MNFAAASSVARFADGAIVVVSSIVWIAALLAGKNSLVSFLVLGSWILVWIFSFISSSRPGYIPWLLRFAASLFYLLYAAVIWKRTELEAHGYLILFGIPFFILLIIFLVLFALARRQTHQGGASS